jgi:Cu/Zn superoxide dismutase
MGLITRLLIASLMGIVVLIGSVSRSSADGSILRARARVSGVAGSGISGEILFFQVRQGIPAEALILARVEGLAPNSVHGFHLHENGTCSSACPTPTPTILSIWATCPTSGPMAVALPYSST